MKVLFLVALAVIGATPAVSQYSLTESPAVGEEVSRILFGSCLVPQWEHPILDAVVASRPDLFIFTGDNVYADTTVPEVMARHYDALARSPRFRALAESARVIATWDDHDYGSNDAGAGYPMRSESERQFEEFWGIPPDGPAGSRPGIYQSYLFGPPSRRVQVILLDTRYFRSALVRTTIGETVQYAENTDPDATILGAEQWRWLREELQQPAKVRIIVSSIQALAPPHGWESWSNFPLERQRLLAAIAGRDGGLTVLLSGDRHFAEMSAVPLADGTELLDVTSSGLNRGYPADRPGANRLRAGGYYLDHNYGVLTISWNGHVPTVLAEVADSDGSTVLGPRVVGRR